MSTPTNGPKGPRGRKSAPITAPINFNPAMLVLARESRGLTQAEVATTAQLSQGALSKIENGLIAPPQDVCVRLAHVLRVPVTLFEQPYSPQGMPSWFHRKRARLPQRVLGRIEAEMNLAVLRVSRLLRSVEIEASHRLPDLDLDLVGTPEEAARRTRQALQLPAGPILNLIASVESAGCVVMLRDFGTRDLDGLGFFHHSFPPLFLLNSSSPTDRLRFTLAHELGHVVMHRNPTEDMEREADRFAAEFLMPAQDVRPHLHGLTMSKLPELKRFWRVSMAALLRRAQTLQLIPEWRARQYWASLAKQGYKLREPPELEPPAESPRTMRALLDAHLRDLAFSLEELAAAVHAMPDDIAADLEPLRPRLRLIV